jgi:uncharacterized membrane protein YhaH (DUF805 family)
MGNDMSLAIDPLVAAGVLACTAVTDAAYVMFTSAVLARKRFWAANWSGIWYLLSAFAVISYTHQAVYVVFAAIGSWLGAFVTVSYLGRNPP